MTARVTQEVVEVLSQQDNTLNSTRTTHEFVEVLARTNNTLNATRTTHEFVEVLAAGPSSLIVTTQFVKVLVKNMTPVTKGWTASYGVSGQLTKGWTASYNVNTYVNKTWDATFNVPLTVAKSWDALYNSFDYIGSANPASQRSIPGNLVPGLNEVAGVGTSTYWTLPEPTRAVLGDSRDYPGGTIPGSAGTVGVGADVVYHVLLNLNSLVGGTSIPGQILLGFQPHVGLGTKSTWKTLNSPTPFTSVLGTRKNVFGEIALGFVPLVSRQSGNTQWRVSNVRYVETSIYGQPKANYGKIVWGFVPVVSRGQKVLWNTLSNSTPEALYGDLGTYYGNIAYGIYPSVGVGRTAVWGSGIAQVIRTTLWNQATPNNISARVSQSVLQVLANETPNARVSQSVLQVLANQTPNARVSQNALLVLVPSSVPDINVTQVFAQAAILFNSPIRLTAVWAQATTQRTPDIRISEAFAQAISQATPNVRITHSFVQVIKQLPTGTAGDTRDTEWGVSSDFVVTQVNSGDMATTWYVRKLAPSDERDTSWDVLFGATVTPVGDDRDTTWNQRSVRSKSLSTTWTVVGHGAKTANVKWNTFATLPRYNAVSLWLKADEGVTVDGIDGVSTWQNFGSPDYYGWDGTQNHDAVQASTFARPTLISNELNGLPVVRFDGVTDYLPINNSPGLVYYANFYGSDVFVVMKDRRADGNPRYIVSEASITANDTAWFLGTTNTSPTGFIFSAYYGGNQDTYGDLIGTPDLTHRNAGRGDAQAGEWVLTTAEFTPNGGNMPTVYVNQSDQGHTWRQIGGIDWFNNYSVGRHGSLNEGYWQGDIAELIVYGSTGIYDIFGRFVNNTLSLEEKTQVEDYLKLKWFGVVSVSMSSDSTTWNVEHLPVVSVQGQVIYNSIHNPFLNVGTTWVVAPAPTITVNRQRQIIWGVRAHITSDEYATEWNVVHLPMVGPDPTEAIWNVAERPHVGIDAEATWLSTLKVIPDAVLTKWNIWKVRTKFRTIYFNDRNNVNPGETEATWNSNESVAATSDTTWNTRKLALRLMNPQPENRTRFNVFRDSDTTVNQQIYGEWNSRHTVSAQDQTTWSLNSVATKTAAPSWKVRATVNKAPATTWRVIAHASRNKNTFWIVFPNAKYGFPLWNVHTLVGMSSQKTKWVVISYNNNTSDTSWMTRSLVGKTEDTTWRIRPPAIQLNVEALWNLRMKAKAGRPDTEWDVSRIRRKFVTTYWENITGIVHCDVPLPTQHVRISGQVRYKISGSLSPKLLTNTTWVTRRLTGHALTGSDAPRTQLAAWRVYTKVTAAAGDFWIIAAFTTSVNRDTAWTTFTHSTKTKAADWNVRLRTGGDPTDHQRESMWNVNYTAIPDPENPGQYLANTGLFTGWDVFYATDKAVQALWFTVGTARKSSTATWKVIGNNNIASITYWTTKAHVDKTDTTTWRTRITGPSVQREVKFNTHTDLFLQRDTTWNVSVRVQAGTTWITLRNAARARTLFLNDQTVVTINRDTTWAIGVRTGAGTLWNASQHAGKSATTFWPASAAVGPIADATWNAKIKVNQDTDETTWNDKKLVANVRVGSWDYSVVGTSSGSGWGTRKIAKLKEPMGGTLWNVHPPCGAEFIAADQCTNFGQGACGTTALVPKVTVCEMTRQKGVKATSRGKYVKKYL